MFAILGNLFSKKQNKSLCAYGISGKENHDEFMALCDHFELTEMRIMSHFEVKGVPHWNIWVSMPDAVRDRFNFVVREKRIAKVLS